MPVNETLDLQRNLQRRARPRLDRIFMNGIYPELFYDDEAATLRERIEHDEAANGDGSRGAAARGPARSRSPSTAARARTASSSSACATESGQEPVELPFLFRPQLDMDAVEELADTIEEQV